jgi:RNA polymerase sigma factor (sigma-70 family)
MVAHDALAELLVRFQNRDPDAAARIFHHFTRRLLALARARLDLRTRGKCDPDDIVQSVYRSFLGRLDAGHLRFDSWDALWALLSLMTVRKCARQMEYFLAACRDVRLEIGLSEDALIQVPAREPLPDDAVALADLVEQLLCGLDEREREIVVLHLQGHSLREISAQSDCAYRTVRRVIDRARRRLLRLWDEEE